MGRLAAAGGNELASGKLHSPDSSAALAINAFGWFINRPALLPAFPNLACKGWPPIRVEVEYCARFPWSGGRPPWLDACVETDSCVIGVESKRYEPFRDRKQVAFSAAYSRPVWGAEMRGWEAMRDALASGEESFQYLDAAQLVKHGFGLVTEGVRKNKTASLVYLFAEPPTLGSRSISLESKDGHRREIERFAKAVAGSAVAFESCSYREWFAKWDSHGPEAQGHKNALLQRFDL